METDSGTENQGVKSVVPSDSEQEEINILLYTFWSWTARTCLDCKNKGLFGSIWATFQLLVKSSYINVLSALKWQASLNSSLNGQIKVDLVKMTIFEVILPHRMGLIAIGAI